MNACGDSLTSETSPLENIIYISLVSLFAEPNGFSKWVRKSDCGRLTCEGAKPKEIRLSFSDLVTGFEHLGSHWRLSPSFSVSVFEREDLRVTTPLKSRSTTIGAFPSLFTCIFGLPGARAFIHLRPFPALFRQLSGTFPAAFRRPNRSID